MMMNVVAILAMVVAATEAGPGMMGMGMGMPMGGMGGMGGMFPGMMKPMGMMHGPHEEPRKMLTCQLNFRNAQDPSKISNAISVNIRERPVEAMNKMNMYGMGKMNMMTHGTKANKPGLEADIGLFSATGGKIVVAVTECARPQDGCDAEDFGNFLKAHDHDNHNMGRPMGMMGKYGMGGMGMKYGMGGMGGMGYGMGYGLPGGSYGSSSVKHQSMSPFGSSNVMKSTNYGGGYGMGGMGMSPMMMGMGMGMGNPMMMKKMKMMGMKGGVPHTHENEPEGILASAEIAPGNKASIVIDRLKGFESLEDLAGRGIIVCPQDNIDHDFDDNSKCDGGILACCALHYDTNEVKLGGDDMDILSNSFNNRG